MNRVANKASAETTARVWRAVKELGYRPGSVGRALRQQQSRLVALLAANLANPAMAAIAASTEMALREAGLVMVLCDTHERPDLQDEYLLEMRAQLACAIVMLGAVASAQLTAEPRTGEALLFVGRTGPVPSAPFVGIDNVRAGIEVAQFFQSRGVSAPGLLHASRASSATDGRVAGFLSVLGEAVVVPGSGSDHLAIGYHGIADLIGGTGRRGVFCTSDLIAYGAHRRLAEMGVRVPGDVLLVGFDDNPLNDWLAPWLTSVRVPYDDFGPAVVCALDAVRRGEAVRCILDHRLVIRGEG
jgi:LacI family transcriptional regulator